jgi:flagellar hook assembly protein FlgD
MLSGAPLPALAADAVTISIYGATPAVVFPVMDTGVTSVSFWYSPSRSSNVTVDVVDASQTTVRTLVSGQSTPGGYYSNNVSWDLRAANGLWVPDGLYTLRGSAVAGDGGTG